MVEIVDNTSILISACLIGQAVRYDGNGKLINHSILINWSKLGILIPLCPEVKGGLPIPRSPAEIKKDSNGTIAVVNIDNNDVTEEFKIGANIALEVCLKKNVKMAILTESSPSCGSNEIYDGSLSAVKIKGEGITSILLRENGIKVFNEF